MCLLSFIFSTAVNPIDELLLVLKVSELGPGSLVKSVPETIQHSAGVLDS